MAKAATAVAGVGTAVYCCTMHMAGPVPQPPEPPEPPHHPEPPLKNIARYTRAEMKAEMDAVSLQHVTGNMQMVYKLCSVRAAKRCFRQVGVRASDGQAGGGVYLSTAGPHELDWEPNQGGPFRSTAGRELFASNAHKCLEGGEWSANLDALLVIIMPKALLTAAVSVPGRPYIKVVPDDVLTPSDDGYYWLDKRYIHKAYELKPTGDASARVSPPPAVDLAAPQPQELAASALSKRAEDMAVRKMASSQMAGKVLDRTVDYSDRRQLRQDVTEWAQDTASCEPGCLLIGGPGAGKTTLLTELVEAATAGFHDTVLATHFCAAHDSESLTPQAFVSGIATQLYKSCRPYREYVDATDSVRGKVKKLLSGDFDGDPTSGFADLLMRPLKAVFLGGARPEGGRFVLCIDSLDEALLLSDAAEGQAAQSSTIVQLLKTCSSKRLFPPWLKVVATSRDVPEVGQLKSWKRIDLGSAVRLTENKTAVRAYINIRLDALDSPLKARVDEMVEAQAEAEASEPEREDAEELATFHCHASAHAYFEALVDRSGGNFLYVATALNDVEAGMGDLADADSLPSRLDELFLHFFERLFEGADGEKYTRVRPVFEAIGASETGVTEVELLKYMRVCEPAAEERALKAALQDVRQFLKGAIQSGSGQRVLVCYHLSFAAWLEAEDNEYAITIERGHRSLAIVQWATLTRELTPALADEMASVCVEELECDGGLTGKLLRKLRPKGAAVALSGGTVYSLARHMAIAIEHAGAAWDVLGGLVQRGVGDVNVRAAANEESLEGVSLKDFLESKLELAAAARMYDIVMKHSTICTAAEMRAMTKEELRTMYDKTEYAAFSDEFLEAKLAALHPAMGKCALQLAVEARDEPVVQFLLVAGACPSIVDEAGQMPLHWAAKHGATGCMRALLRCPSPPDVNAKDKTKRTTLHLAARNGHMEVVQYLLSKEVGAELEATDVAGFMALHWAAYNGHVEALRYLLSAEVGAELEAKTQVHGATALHYAAFNGQVEALRYLLSAEVGAELEAKDKYGMTALHRAAANGQVEALRYLLSAEVGAELEAKDKDGRTALHWAARGGYVEALEVLVELGASVNPDGDGGVRLFSMAGESCGGDDAAEKAATVATLRRLGVGPGPETAAPLGWTRARARVLALSRFLFATDPERERKP
eukprot:COSAG01_NODE_1266_length_10987_cov_8.631980_1_plen_1169_part_00